MKKLSRMIQESKVDEFRRPPSHIDWEEAWDMMDEKDPMTVKDVDDMFNTGTSQTSQDILSYWYEGKQEDFEEHWNDLLYN